MEEMPQARLLITRYEALTRIVNVINMSKQGLCFIMAKNENITIKKGEYPIMLTFQGDDSLKDIQAVNMVVRWTLSKKELYHNMYGCEFLNMPSNFQFQLNMFIDQIITDKLASYEQERNNLTWD